jgi:hypothetical protein
LRKSRPNFDLQGNPAEVSGAGRPQIWILGLGAPYGLFSICNKDYDNNEEPEHGKRGNRGRNQLDSL